MCGTLLLLLAACASDVETSVSIAVPVAKAPVGPSLTSTSTTQSPDNPTSTSSPPAANSSDRATDPSREISLLKDQPYYESNDGTTLDLDVYYPTSGHSHPLVVLFHANPVFGTTKESVQTLATMIAERGAVVVAPTWGNRMSMGDMQSIAQELNMWVTEQGPCAVWRAADLAAFTGADGSHVVLIGEAAGVLPAQAATFDPPTNVDGCLSPPSAMPVERAILFDTDWLLVPDIWDEVLTEEPDYLAVSSYWDHSEAPTWTRITMLVGEDTAPETIRSLEGDTYLESEWIRLRDPDGRLAEAFATSGTLEDGSMSFTDVTHVVTSLLTQGGWDAELLTVPGAGHALRSQAARAFVTDLVFDN